MQRTTNGRPYREIESVCAYVDSITPGGRSIRATVTFVYNRQDRLKLKKPRINFKPYT